EDGLVNYTRSGRLRVDFTFTLTYGQDLARVREVVNDIVAHDQRVLTTPAPELSIDDLADTGIRVSVGPTIRATPDSTPQDYWDGCSDLREQMATRFKDEDITFAVSPFQLPFASAPPPGGEST